MALNPAQTRAILATLSHVSELLDGVLGVTRDDANPFDRTRADLSPAEKRRLVALVEAARSRMLEALATLGVPVPEPEGSARWSARTAFHFGEISLSELSGEGLRAYGAVDESDARLVSAVSRDLTGLLERAESLLRGVDPDAVEASVARVDGAAGDALREIWRFVRTHELIDVYSDVAAVAERAVAPAADVGVFGRTNAGKSSLINAVVGRDVLPVGIVPVTAIPLRLARGPAVLRLHRDGGGSEDRPLEEIELFSLDSLGSADTDLSAIDAFVPTAPPGLRLIDTPGVGSFHTPVGARAFEWLPRCDLGLLLVPAGSMLEAEDLALLRGLAAAAVEVQVVLSKADLVSAEDLEATRHHMRRELERALAGRAPDVHSVSVSDDRNKDVEDLKRRILEPLVREHEGSAEIRLRRRVANLVEVAAAAFEGRNADALESMAERKAEIEGARRRIDEVLARLRAAGPSALAAAADALAAAWRERSDGAAGAVHTALTEPAETALQSVRGVLREVEEGSAAPIPRPMPPLFLLDDLDDLPSLEPGKLGGRVFSGRAAAQRLAPLRDAVDAAVIRYAGRLGSWSSAVLATLAEGAVGSEGGGTSAEVEALRRALDAVGYGSDPINGLDPSREATDGMPTE